MATATATATALVVLVTAVLVMVVVVAVVVLLVVAVVRFTALGRPSGRSPKRAATSPPWQWGVNCTRWVVPGSRGGDSVRWRSSIQQEAAVAVCGQTWMLLNYRGPIAHLL